MPVFFACLAALLLLPFSAGAENGTAQAEESIVSQSYESGIEVIVTASRIEEIQKNVPASVTVITKDEIAESGEPSIAGVIGNCAGIYFKYPGNQVQAEVTMRGFGENSHGRVLVCLNGHRLNSPDMAGVNWLSIRLEDVERIEIIRGGESVFYGNNAVAGVINIITKKPESKLSFELAALGGSYWFNQERGSISGAIGALAIILSGSHTSETGYREHSAFDSEGGGLNLTLDATDSIRATLDASYTRTFTELPGGLAKDEMNDDPTQVHDTNKEDDTSSHNIYSNGGVKITLDDWGILDLAAGYSLRFVQNNIASYTSFSDVTVHTTGLAPRLSITLGQDDLAHRLIFGSDLGWDYIDKKGFADASRASVDNNPFAHRYTGGIYGQYKLDIAHDLHLSAGCRLEAAYVKAASSSDSSLSGEKLSTGFVYNGGIAWNFIKDAKLYARFSTLYRYPFIDEQTYFYGASSNFFLADLESEQGYNAEAGAEVTLFDKALTLGSGVFLIDMEKEIAYNNDTFRNENLDKTRHIGSESSLNLVLKDLLELKANYAFTYAYFREDAKSHAGKLLPLVSCHNLFTEAAFHLPYGFIAGGSLKLLSDYYEGGDYDNQKAAVQGYKVVNLFLRFKPSFIPGKLELSFLVENLLDEKYASYANWGAFYPAPGITLKAGAMYKY